MTTTEIDIDEEVLDKIDISNAFVNNLILFNDDVNSFEDVILALIIVCELEQEKAVNLALEAHQKGKALIKSGEYNNLKKEATMLGDYQITVEIQ